MLSPFRMVCRDFILPEICKPCPFLSSFQFAKLILPYPIASHYTSFSLALLRGLGVVSTFGNGYSIFKVQLRLYVTFIFRLSSPRKNKKPLCINTNHRRERLALASNQMLIHNGFELIQKTILFVSAQLHLKQYKKFTVASHGFLKRDHRRYSGLVPNYTSTRTSYSVVVPL